MTQISTDFLVFCAQLPAFHSLVQSKGKLTQVKWNGSKKRKRRKRVKQKVDEESWTNNVKLERNPNKTTFIWQMRQWETAWVGENLQEKCCCTLYTSVVLITKIHDQYDEMKNWKTI